MNTARGDSIRDHGPSSWIPSASVFDSFFLRLAVSAVFIILTDTADTISLMKLLYRTNQQGYLLDADMPEHQPWTVALDDDADDDGPTPMFWTQAVWYGDGCCKDHGSRMIEIQEVDFLEEDDLALPVERHHWHLYRLRDTQDQIVDATNVVRQYTVLRDPVWKHGEHCGLLRHGLVLRDLSSLITAERERDEQSVLHFHVGLALHTLRARNLDTEVSRSEYTEECTKEGICLHEKNMVDRLDNELEDLQARFLWLDNRIESDFERMCLDADAIHSWLETVHTEHRFTDGLVNVDSDGYSTSLHRRVLECSSDVLSVRTLSISARTMEETSEEATIGLAVEEKTEDITPDAELMQSFSQDSSCMYGPNGAIRSSTREPIDLPPQLPVRSTELKLQDEHGEDRNEVDIQEEREEDRNEPDIQSPEADLSVPSNCERTQPEEHTPILKSFADAYQQKTTTTSSIFACHRPTVDDQDITVGTSGRKETVTEAEGHAPTILACGTARGESNSGAETPQETPRQTVVRRSDILRYWRDRTSNAASPRIHVGSNRFTACRPVATNTLRKTDAKGPDESKQSILLQQHYIMENDSQCRYDLQEQETAIEITLRQDGSWEVQSHSETCTVGEGVTASNSPLAKSFMDAISISKMANTVMCTAGVGQEVDILSTDSHVSVSEHESLVEERTHETEDAGQDTTSGAATELCDHRLNVARDASDGVQYFKELERESAAELFLSELEREECLYMARSEKLHLNQSFTSEEDDTIDVESELRFWKEYTLAMTPRSTTA